MTIGLWVTETTRQLALIGIASARLDAEIILAHSLKQHRTYLHAHPDEALSPRCEEIANARLDLRLDHVPIAYIIGHKEFYGRLFSVSPATLIPRPESEQLIELLNLALPSTTPLIDMPVTRLADIGTGSGCLGITAKLEHPELEVTLLDTSRAALAVASKNATKFHIDVRTLQSNLLDAYPYAPNIVLANLPYVGEDWERSEETAHEPASALFAQKDGVALIEKCFSQLSTRMKTGDIAIFEADPRQWQIITSFAKQLSFDLTQQRDYAALFTKR